MSHSVLLLAGLAVTRIPSVEPVGGELKDAAIGEWVVSGTAVFKQGIHRRIPGAL